MEAHLYDQYPSILVHHRVSIIRLLYMLLLTRKDLSPHQFIHPGLIMSHNNLMSLTQQLCLDFLSFFGVLALVLLLQHRLASIMVAELYICPRFQSLDYLFLVQDYQKASLP